MQVKQNLPTIRQPLPGHDGAAQQTYRQRLNEFKADVATRIDQLECAKAVAEAANLIAQEEMSDEQPASGKSDAGDCFQRCEQAARTLQACEQDLHRATRLQEELTAISKDIDGYIAALESDNAGARSTHHGRYVDAKAKLEEWECAWSQLQGGASSETTEAVRSDGPAEERPTAPIEVAQAVLMPIPATEADPLNEAFPSDAAGQAQHIVAMQAQIQRVEDARRSEFERSRQLLDQIKALTTDKQLVSSELTADYRDSLRKLDELATRIDSCREAYAKRISAKLKDLHPDALEELYPLAGPVQDLDADAHDEQISWKLFKKHEAAIEALKSEFAGHGADPDALKYFNILMNKLYVVFKVHAGIQNAAAEIERIQQALPPEVRVPIGRASSKFGVEDLRESLKANYGRDGGKYNYRKFHGRDTLGLEQMKDAIEFDRLIKGLDLAKQGGKRALSEFVLHVSSKARAGSWLMNAGDPLCELFSKVKDAYLDLARTNAPEDERAAYFSRLANSGASPDDLAAIQRWLTRRSLLREASPQPSLTGQPANRASKSKTVSTRLAHADKPSKANRASEPEISTEEPDSLPTTTEVSAEALATDDWISPAKPAWTSYIPFGGDAGTYLRDTHPALESRASNLWNWNQSCMLGSAFELQEDHCLPLIDWIASHSAGTLPEHDRLFTHYSIVCGPGTGDFKNTWQLKIINLDPEVPGIPTGRFIGNKRELKRPTYHVNVDPAAVPAIRQALASRGFAVDE